jgi:hypothetical protein
LVAQDRGDDLETVGEPNPEPGRIETAEKGPVGIEKGDRTRQRKGEDRIAWEHAKGIESPELTRAGPTATDSVDEPTRRVEEPQLQAGPICNHDPAVLEAGSAHHPAQHVMRFWTVSNDERRTVA